MHPGIHAARRIAVTVVVVGLALAGTVAISPAAAAPLPRCTKRAIAAGLGRGPYKTPGAMVEDFQCAGRFALTIDVYEGITVPALLRARGTGWVTVNREKPCKEHAVPKKLYFNACIAS
jgi:hypothetical protein